MTPSSPQAPQPNPHLAEATKLVATALAGGSEAAYGFAELVQFLLSKTIMAPGEAISLHRGGSHRYVISGRKRQSGGTARELFLPVRLNNGNYLYIFYDNFIDKDDNQYLKTIRTKIAYQRDPDGEEQFFRFDHSREAENQYPFAQLHVHGRWMHEGALKDLHRIHFPVIRPTIEGTIRLLVDEFGVETATPADIWRPILKHTEDKFLKVARTRSAQPG